MEKTFSTFSVIPTEIMVSKEISSTAKIVYGLISSLTNEKGYCWASNKYLGELVDKEERQISNIINQLSSLGFIISEVEDNYKRKIILTGKIATQKNARGVEKNYRGGSKKMLHNNIKEYYKDNIDTAKPSFAEVKQEHSKEIQEIFNLFYEINPTINFGNKTQRSAAEDMIKKFGAEKTINTVKFAISVQGKRYAPTITNPLELKNNMGKLLVYNKREQEPVKGSMPIFKF